MDQLNVLAVGVAGFIPMIIGMIWYSPVMFAKKWMALVGKTEDEIKKSSPGKAYALSFVGSLVMAYVLAHIIQIAQANTIGGGMQIGLWAWLGFVVTTSSATVLFEFRPAGLYYMNAAYNLACLLAMGALLGFWK